MWWGGWGIGGLGFSDRPCLAGGLWLRLNVAPMVLPEALHERIEARIDAVMTTGDLDIGEMALDLPEGGRAPVIEFRDVRVVRSRRGAARRLSGGARASGRRPDPVGSVPPEAAWRSRARACACRATAAGASTSTCRARRPRPSACPRPWPGSTRCSRGPSTRSAR
jgi:hypothetical protein